MPPPVSFNHKRWCTLPCHKFPKFACATKTAHSVYDWVMYYVQKKDFVQCPADKHVILPNLLQLYKTPIEHVPHHSAAAMATSRQPVTNRKRALEPVLDASSDICPYWPASPTFDPQRVLLRRLFFINSDKTKYVSVSTLHATICRWRNSAAYGGASRNPSFPKTSISTPG